MRVLCHRGTYLLLSTPALGSWSDSVTLFCFAASITTCHWWLPVFHNQMSQQIWWLCQTLSSIGQPYWAHFTLDHLSGLQVAYEWVPCSVCCGQVNLWLRIPQTAGRKSLFNVTPQRTLLYASEPEPGLCEGTVLCRWGPSLHRTPKAFLLLLFRFHFQFSSHVFPV